MRARDLRGLRNETVDPVKVEGGWVFSDSMREKYFARVQEAVFQHVEVVSNRVKEARSLAVLDEEVANLKEAILNLPDGKGNLRIFEETFAGKDFTELYEVMESHVADIQKIQNHDIIQAYKKPVMEDVWTQLFLIANLDQMRSKLYDLEDQDFSQAETEDGQVMDILDSPELAKMQQAIERSSPINRQVAMMVFSPKSLASPSPPSTGSSRGSFRRGHIVTESVSSGSLSASDYRISSDAYVESEFVNPECILEKMAQSPDGPALDTFAVDVEMLSMEQPDDQFRIVNRVSLWNQSTFDLGGDIDRLGLLAVQLIDQAVLMEGAMVVDLCEDDNPILALAIAQRLHDLEGKMDGLDLTLVVDGKEYTEGYLNAFDVLREMEITPEQYERISNLVSLVSKHFDNHLPEIISGLEERGVSVPKIMRQYAEVLDQFLDQGRQQEAEEQPRPQSL